MKAAILARSSELDREGDRVDAQVDECAAWAAGHGYTVEPGHVFTEVDISGRLDPELRGALQQAWSLLATGAVDAIIVRDYSRLGRRLDTAQLVQNSRAHGRGIIFVRVPATDDKLGQMITDGAFGLISAVEALVIFDRTSRGRKRVMERGQLGSGGIPSYLCWSKELGYSLNEKTADHIRRAIYAYEAGEPVLKILSDGLMARPAFYSFIDNPALAGRRYCWPVDANPSGERKGWKNMRQVARRKIIREMAGKTIDEADAIARDAGMIVQEVPALIPWERWQGIIKLKAQRRATPPAHQTMGLPLQGRMTCALCGSTYVVSPTVAGKRLYIQCSRRLKARSIDIGRTRCLASPRFRYERVEQAVAQQIAEWVTNPDAIREAAEQYLSGLDADIARLEIAVGPVAEELKRARERRARYAKLWGDGDITDADWQKEREHCQREITRLEAQAEGVEDSRLELEFVKQRASEIRTLLAGGPFFSSPEARLLGQLQQHLVEKKLTAGDRATVAKALERYNVNLEIGREGIRMRAAILPDPVEISGVALKPSGRPAA